MKQKIKIGLSLTLICLLAVPAARIHAADLSDMTQIQESLAANCMSREAYNRFFEELTENADAGEPMVTAAAAEGTEEEAVYDSAYDPREENMVTSVKTQSYGTCWAYGATATAESALLHQGLADTSVDLSELQYAYYYWKDKYSSLTYKKAFNQGAVLTQAWEYMLNGIGPADEETFGALADYAGEDIADDLLTEHLYDVDELAYDSYTGTDYTPIKRLISEYGGVSIAYYADEKNVYYLSDPVSASSDAYNNTGDATYYNPNGTSESVNHMVEIVGWDDDYPAENFFE